MILKESYKEDLIDWINRTPDEIFGEKGYYKKDVINDETVMEQLWTIYQKDVEEYDCDEIFSYSEAVHEVLGLSAEDIRDVLYKEDESATNDHDEEDSENIDIFVKYITSDGSLWIRTEDSVGEEYPVKTNKDIIEAFKKYIENNKIF